MNIFAYFLYIYLLGQLESSFRIPFKDAQRLFLLRTHDPLSVLDVSVFGLCSSQTVEAERAGRRPPRKTGDR